MKKDRFYKTSPHGHVGSNVSFHAIDGKGYVTNLDQVHVYTRSEAQNAVDKGHLRFNNSEELFLSADHVDELLVMKVDHQYVNQFYPDVKDPNNEYVIYRNKTFDGNDLGFFSSMSYNFDYSLAKVYREDELNNVDLDEWTIIPKSHTDQIARKTFQFYNINRRKMISSAGIIGIKKKRVKHGSGKTRFNCPGCGKIVWQYNPHDFESCSDVFCDI